LVLFVILKYQLRTIILSIGIKYSVRDLLCVLNNYIGLYLNRKEAICVHMVNDVSAPFGSSSP